jgi:hypothetical protein
MNRIVAAVQDTSGATVCQIVYNIGLMGLLALIAAAKKRRRRTAAGLFEHDNASHFFLGEGGLMYAGRAQNGLFIQKRAQQGNRKEAGSRCLRLAKVSSSAARTEMIYNGIWPCWVIALFFIPMARSSHRLSVEPSERSGKD